MEEKKTTTFDPLKSPLGSLQLLALGYKGLIIWKKNIKREQEKND